MWLTPEIVLLYVFFCAVIAERLLLSTYAGLIWLTPEIVLLYVFFCAVNCRAHARRIVKKVCFCGEGIDIGSKLRNNVAYY